MRRKEVEVMTAKEYLSRAKNIKIRISTMSEQLEYLKAAALYTSPPIGDAPKPHIRNIRKNEDAYIRVIEKENEIKAAQEKLLEIAAAIDSVKDPILQAIVCKRYLCGKAWYDISCELNFSISRIYELHRDALAEIDGFLKHGAKT
jgi:hypothetical protein